MPNNPNEGGSALDDFLEDVVIYRGYPVKRASAFLLEDELGPNDDISMQLWIGRLDAEEHEHAMPMSHARGLIHSDLQRYDRYLHAEFGI